MAVNTKRCGDIKCGNAKKRKVDRADSAPEGPKKRELALSHIERAKRGFYHALLITERLVGRFTDTYRNIFVVDKDTHATFFKEEAFGHFKKGNYDKAINLFLSHIKEVGEGDVDLLFHLGLSYASCEEFNEALNYLKKAQEIESDDVNIAQEIGNCCLKLERYNEAIDCFRMLTEVVPDVSDNFYHLATAYEKTGRLGEAIDMYKRAIELEPRNPLRYHALGFAYESKGQHNDAIACFKKAMELEKTR
jgi:tetratricopeptide (TPR) repeat protein